MHSQYVSFEIVSTALQNTESQMKNREDIVCNLIFEWMLRSVFC